MHRALVQLYAKTGGGGWVGSEGRGAGRNRLGEHSV